MNDNRIMKQMHAIFSVFMVLFYVGIGIFLLFFSKNVLNIDKAMSSLIGGTLLLYGLYRIYVTYKQIIEAFFNKDNTE